MPRNRRVPHGPSRPDVSVGEEPANRNLEEDEGVTPRDALILVDLQNDFMPGGALAVARGDEVIAIANGLQPLFKMVIATRDWHSPEHGSFATSHPGSQPGDVIELAGQSQVLWPKHCMQHSPGAELASALDPCSGRYEVFKGEDPEVDSYSGFFDNDHGASCTARQYRSLATPANRHWLRD